MTKDVELSQLVHFSYFNRTRLRREQISETISISRRDSRETLYLLKNWRRHANLRAETDKTKCVRLEIVYETQFPRQCALVLHKVACAIESFISPQQAQRFSVQVWCHA